jgi:hypothetical protein
VLGARGWEGWVGLCRGEGWGAGTAGLLAGRASCWESATSGCRTAPSLDGATRAAVQRSHRSTLCHSVVHMARVGGVFHCRWSACRERGAEELREEERGVGGRSPPWNRVPCMREGGRPADRHGGRSQSGWRARVLMPDDSLHCHSSCLKHLYTPSGAPSSSGRVAH